jgi:chemotaxis protein MotA
MNASSTIGIILAIVVFVASAFTAVTDRKVLLDYHAILIVIGGTISVTLISFSFKSLIGLFKVFFNRVIGSKQEKYEAVITEVVELAKGYREDAGFLSAKVAGIKNPFLKEGIQLMVDGGLEANEIEQVMAKRAMMVHQRYEQDAEMFKALGKYPPAFGLLGAVLGIIAMMQGLGSADAIKKVGPALAVALVATLYGIAVANFILLPLGENLHKANKFDFVLRQMIIDGLRLIRQKKHPLVVEENLKSYLLPGERAALKKAS